jgi:phosphoserine phosphatase
MGEGGTVDLVYGAAAMEGGMYVATLIAADALDDGLFTEWVHQIDADWTCGRTVGADWVDRGSAGDLTFEPDASFTRADGAHLADGLRELAERIALATGKPASFDVVVQPVAQRSKRLLVADMDSTMIQCECIDELADYAGIKPEIAAITEAAMRGELDFAGALDARVALLAGLDEAVIARCLAERVRDMPGARALVATMRARGGEAVLVSGGFTRFAEPVAARLGFSAAVANVLEVADGQLTGRVARPIVGADAKLDTLVAWRTRLGLPRDAVLAVGDGANDLRMLGEAGLGVAYRAKPVVAAAAAARIEAGDLRALLWAQGLPRAQWAADA